MNAVLLFAQNSPDGGAGIVGGMLAFVVLMWVVGIAATVFWVWMLVDALVNERTTEEKILWFLVIFLLHILGALIYLFVRNMGRAGSTAAP